MVPVRIFTAGETLPSGAIADEAFLDRVVANWDKFQAKGDPRFPSPPAYLIPAASVGIGHSDDQSIARAYADRSDLPAVGWPTEVHRDGDGLIAHLEGIPAGLASWVNAGAYKSVSSEFYEDYRGHGPCLRRVSMLGADIPACKDATLPTLVYSPADNEKPNPLAFTEALSAFGRGRSRWAADIGGGQVVTFSESIPEPAKPAEAKQQSGAQSMTPQQQAFVAALQAAGFDVSKLDGAALDSLMKAAAPATAAEPPKPPEPAPTPPVAKNSDGADTPNTDGDPNKEPSFNAEDMKDPAKCSAKFSEILSHQNKRIAAAVAAAVAPVQAKLDTIQKDSTSAVNQLATAAKERERGEIAAFCEKNKDRIFPFEMDPKNGSTLVDRLLNLPAAAVATFAEGKLSPRAAEMKAIENRPAVAKFAEHIAAPMDNSPGAEVARALASTRLGRSALAAKEAAAAKK